MNRALTFLLAVLSLFTVNSWINVASSQPMEPVQRQILKVENKPSYKLQVGDELELTFYSLPQLDKKYVVRVDGCFLHPALGEVRAVGLTLNQIQVDIEKRARKELKNPSFHLGLLSYAKSEVAVLGEVRSQGKFAILPGATVLDVLAQAGGLSDKADPEAASLLRNGKSVEIDLRPPSGERVDAFKMEAGDVLYIHAGNRVSVAGEVQKPGVYAVSRNSKDPIGDALKASGGAKPTAALRRVKLLRPSLPAPLLISAVPGPDGLMPPDARSLQDGDTLVIPERQAILLGSCSKQGAISLQGGESLFDIISGGGLTDKAELSRIVVIRADDVKAGRGNREEYNLADYFQEKKDTAPVIIYDGDLVYVPTKVESKGFLDMTSGVLPLILMARSLLL